jgi:carboxypeptidase C (cathepsin A)
LLSNAKALLDQVDALTGNIGHGIIDAVEHKLEDVFNVPQHHDQGGHDEHYDRVSLMSFSDHSLRVSKKKSTLCDPDVKQHNGYLDVTDGKHLFFWYFEARHKPEDKPLLLW